MVLNLGQRPTFADGDGLSVEAHLLHTFGADFYGREVRALVLGFLRPELRFGSLPELLDRIRQDIGLARAQLAAPALGRFALDPRLDMQGFTRPLHWGGLLTGTKRAWLADKLSSKLAVEQILAGQEIQLSATKF